MFYYIFMFGLLLGACRELSLSDRPLAIQPRIERLSETPKVSASHLGLSNIKIEDSEMGQLRLEASTEGGVHDYISYEICTENGSCSVHGKFVSSESLPPMAGEQTIRIKLKACVEAIRLLDKECGKEIEEYYLVGADETGSAKEAELLKKRFALLSEMKDEATKIDDVRKEAEAKDMVGMSKEEKQAHRDLMVALRNFETKGIARNADFFASREFSDMLPEMEAKAKEEAQKGSSKGGLSLTKDVASNWAYPNGDSPQTTEDLSGEHNEVLFGFGVALVIAGSISALVGISYATPNIYSGDVLKNTLDSRFKLLNLYLVSGDYKSARAQLRKIEDMATAIKTEIDSRESQGGSWSALDDRLKKVETPQLMAAKAILGESSDPKVLRDRVEGYMEEFYPKGGFLKGNQTKLQKKLMKRLEIDRTYDLGWNRMLSDKSAKLEDKLNWFVANKPERTKYGVTAGLAGIGAIIASGVMIYFARNPNGGGLVTQEKNIYQKLVDSYLRLRRLAAGVQDIDVELTSKSRSP